VEAEQQDVGAAEEPAEEVAVEVAVAKPTVPTPTLSALRATVIMLEELQSASKDGTSPPR